MSQHENLTPFGQMVLGLSDEISGHRRAIHEHRVQVEQKVSLRDSLDINKLSRGELTGDKKLDAALLLSFQGGQSKDKWPEVTRAIYEMISEEEERLNEWGGGPILYSEISQYQLPYGDALVFGVLEDPSLLIEFTGKGPGGLVDYGAKIKIPGYEYSSQLGSPSMGRDYSQGYLDITRLFHPNLGRGRAEVDRRIRHPEDKRFFGGIYLGEQEIKGGVEEFASFLEGSGYRRGYREYASEIRTHAESFLANPAAVR